MVSKSWQEFLEKHNISADRQAASEQRAHKFIASLKLGELRKARELTQQQLARDPRDLAGVGVGAREPS